MVRLISTAFDQIGLKQQTTFVLEVKPEDISDNNFTDRDGPIMMSPIGAEGGIIMKGK
jgi:hypothetical protein